MKTLRYEYISPNTKYDIGQMSNASSIAWLTQALVLGIKYSSQLWSAGFIFFLQFHCPASRHGTDTACTLTAQRNPGINSLGWEEKYYLLQMKLFCTEFSQGSGGHSEKRGNFNAHLVFSFSRNQTCQMISQHKSLCNASNITWSMLIYNS